MTNITQTEFWIQKFFVISIIQQLLGQQQYIQTLQNQLIKFDFLLQSENANSVFSYYKTLTQNKVPIYSPQSRRLKEITSPFVDYDGKIFAILTDAFTVKFRQSYLFKKSILYSNDNLQIEVQTSYQQNQQLLFYIIILMNKSINCVQNIKYLKIYDFRKNSN